MGPVSILKKSRVSEESSRRMKRERRGVVIVEEREEDPDSEDSALCLQEEDDGSVSSQDQDHAPPPGMDQLCSAMYQDMTNMTMSCRQCSRPRAPQVGGEGCLLV